MRDSAYEDEEADVDVSPLVAWAAEWTEQLYAHPIEERWEFYASATELYKPKKERIPVWRKEMLDYMVDSYKFYTRHPEFPRDVSETLAYKDSFLYAMQVGTGGPRHPRYMREV